MFFRAERHSVPLVHGPFALHIAPIPAEQLLDAAGPTGEFPRAPDYSPRRGIYPVSRRTAHRIARSRGGGWLQRTQLAARVPAVPRHDARGGDTSGPARGSTANPSLRRKRADGRRRRLSIRLYQSRPFLGNSTRKRSAYLRQTTCGAILLAAQAASNATAKFPEPSVASAPNSCAICPAISQISRARAASGKARAVR